nr:uncharacterized protein LOC129388362 [Dermacentor andersoni]
MINISVGAVAEKDNLSVFSGGKMKLTVKETLENVKAYGESTSASDDTVFYLFTWTKNKFNEWNLYENSPGSSEVETTATFCTSNTSAAIIRHFPGSMNYWSSVKSTAFIFGSQNFLNFNTNQRRKINATFSRCYVRNSKRNKSEHTKKPTNVGGC